MSILQMRMTGENDNGSGETSYFTRDVDCGNFDAGEFVDAFYKCVEQAEKEEKILAKDDGFRLMLSLMCITHNDDDETEREHPLYMAFYSVTEYTFDRCLRQFYKEYLG